MALTTVVNDQIFEKLVPVLRELDSEIGPLNLAMLIPSSFGYDYDYLVLSSSRLDEMGLAAATSTVQAKLRERLGSDAAKVGTVSILSTRSYAVRGLTQSFYVPEVGQAHQALGGPTFALGLDKPVLFIAKPLTPIAA